MRRASRRAPAGPGFQLLLLSAVGGEGDPDARVCRSRRKSPTLNAQEIDDVVAFLCTLTDGYDPNNPAANHVPVQCRPGAP